MIRIAIERLHEAPETLSVDAPAADFDLDGDGFQFSGNVRGEIEFKLAGEDVRGVGELATEAVAPCGRCLDPVRIPIRAKIDNVWLKKSDVSDQAPRDVEDDTLADYYEGDWLEPTDVLRDCILFELPSLPRCSEDCKGLCQRCGANLNRERCACQTNVPQAATGETEWKSALKNLGKHSP